MSCAYPVLSSLAFWLWKWPMMARSNYRFRQPTSAPFWWFNKLYQSRDVIKTQLSPGFLFVRFRKNSRWKKLKHWKNSRVIGRKTQFSGGFTQFFIKKTQDRLTIIQEFCLKKWEILDSQAKNELQKCSIDCHHTFSRPYLEFSQKLNDFAPKTQGNGSKTQVPGGFDHFD